MEANMSIALRHGHHVGVFTETTPSRHSHMTVAKQLVVACLFAVILLLGAVVYTCPVWCDMGDFTVINRTVHVTSTIGMMQIESNGKTRWFWFHSAKVPSYSPLARHEGRPILGK